MRVDHFADHEEVQRASEVTVQGGGPVATALVALARLGARVAILDAVGDDWRGDLIREEYRREGVHTDYLRVRNGYTSSVASVLVRGEDGARSIVYAPGNAPTLAADDVARQVIASARFLHVNGRHWEGCLAACRYARESGVQVSFDGGAHLYRPELRELAPMSDVCIVARDFAERYTGAREVGRAARMLLDEGPSLVVVTEGTRGSWVYPRQGEAFHQPAYLLPSVVDTTGCGDSFHGAFLFGLVKGMPLERTAALASAVAALNSQSLGGRGGLPSLEQVSEFLERQPENKFSG